MASLSMRLPAAILDHLGRSNAERRASVLMAIHLEKQLSEMLDGDDLRSLRHWAADHGKCYDHHRAETLARLARLGLTLYGTMQK